MSDIKKEDIERIECRFALHLPEIHGLRPDTHYIKEQITLKDGTMVPNVRLVSDFKRPVWVTQPKYRDHKEHKEFEDVDKLVKLEDTQSNINLKVARYLDEMFRAKNPNLIKESPYVYGYDVTSTSHVKLRYLHKNNFNQSPYTLSILDIETDVDTDEVLMVTVLMKDKACAYVNKKIVGNIQNVPSRVEDKRKEILDQYPDLDIMVKVCEGEVSTIDKAFKKLHQWKPDFVAIWNIDFDIPRIMERLSKNNMEPADVMCDPDVPRRFRMCNYRQGKTKRITASGKVTPIGPAARWHTLNLTASFYVIDAMCVYKQLRIGQPELPSYSLDYVLTKELGITKLKFKQADQYSGADWHRFMQKSYPIEYTLYNIFDCYSMLLLDNKTRDLQNSIGVFAGITDFSRFHSNPTKIVNSLFMFGLERGRVTGTAAPNKEALDKIRKRNPLAFQYAEEDEEDEEEIVTLGLKGWIVTLPAHLLLPMGLNIFKDYPNLVTNIRGLVLDSDARSAYPSATITFNVSKATTLYEIIDIPEVDLELFKIQNIGLVAGDANHIEYATQMFNAPSLHDLID